MTEKLHSFVGEMEFSIFLEKFLLHHICRYEKGHFRLDARILFTSLS